MLLAAEMQLVFTSFILDLIHRHLFVNFWKLVADTGTSLQLLPVELRDSVFRGSFQKVLVFYTLLLHSCFLFLLGPLNLHSHKVVSPSALSLLLLFTLKLLLLICSGGSHNTLVHDFVSTSRWLQETEQLGQCVILGFQHTCDVSELLWLDGYVDVEVPWIASDRLWERCGGHLSGFGLFQLL